MESTTTNLPPGSCPCKKAKCGHHGRCEACRAHHAGGKHPPVCERPAKKKKLK